MSSSQSHTSSKPPSHHKWFCLTNLTELYFAALSGCTKSNLHYVVYSSKEHMVFITMTHESHDVVKAPSMRGSSVDVKVLSLFS